MAETIVAETTIRIQVLGMKKDGVVLNLTGATVTLLMRDPSGTLHTKAATITSASDGNVRYDTAVTDIITPGPWRRAWRVQKGNLDLISLPISFTVVASP